MDPYKIKSVKAGVATARNLLRHAFEELPWTRGESVYVVRHQATGLYFGFVVEGLGTKNLVAIKAMAQAAEKQMPETKRKKFQYQWHNFLARCNAAMNFNDLSTLGIRPLVFGQHIAVEDGTFLQDEDLADGLTLGTAQACDEVQASWGCGETCTLKGIIEPGTAELSGAVWGFCTEKQLIRCNIKAGDRIVLLPSNGCHANGYTMYRTIAELLPEGCLTMVDNRHTYAEALLKPTHLYGPVVERAQELGAEIHYCINFTGHAWRKLMRAREPFVYFIEKLPKPQPIFDFIQQHGKVKTRDMYADCNMGAGYALIVPASSVGKVIQAGKEKGLEPLDAGYVEKDGNRREVHILPVNVYFGPADLKVR
jgi:phosphoribosylformylglycinamidine cyclo-ligase